MQTFYTSDTHFGHFNAIKYDRRPFQTIEEMDEELIKRWNQRVGPFDLVYHLGDVSWYKDDFATAKILNKLNGRIILILGNHDDFLGRRSLNRFEKVYSYRKVRDETTGTKILLSHVPTIFDQEEVNMINFYAHTHVGCDYAATKYYIDMMHKAGKKCVMHNVGCMCWNFAPATFEEIIKSKV